MLYFSQIRLNRKVTFCPWTPCDRLLVKTNYCHHFLSLKTIVTVILLLFEINTLGLYQSIIFYQLIY